MCLAESVAGDSAVAHATAFARAVEKLARREVPAALECERAAALELERMAMQIADTGALCMDVGYQLGQVASEALRTMTINTTQAWCGNRFGKGLIRPGGTNHPLTAEKAETIRRNVAQIARRYDQVRRDIKSSPSLLARFEQCGIVPRDEMQRIGGVGQAARASGLARDIRTSHPWGVFAGALRHESIVKTHGDVMARLMVRCREVLQSAGYIDRLLADYVPGSLPAPDYAAPPAPDSLAFGLIGRIHRPPARPSRTGMRERRTPVPGLCGAAGPLVARVRTGRGMARRDLPRSPDRRRGPHRRRPHQGPEPPQLAGAGARRARRRDLRLPDLQQEFQPLVLRP